MLRMQAVHRARRVQFVNQQALKIRELEATSIRHEKTIETMCESNEIAQLLIAQYKAQEEEEVALEIREQSRRNREIRQNESELKTLRQSNEELRVLLVYETKNLAEAESGARR